MISVVTLKGLRSRAFESLEGLGTARKALCWVRARSSGLRFRLWVYLRIGFRGLGVRGLGCKGPGFRVQRLTLVDPD